MPIGIARASLGFRDMRGFMVAVEAAMGLSWIDLVSMPLDSDQASETYNWLAATPALREWIGGRQAFSLTGKSITITNKEFEATLEIPDADIRRDKTGSIDIRIKDLARRVVGHWTKLLSLLIMNGTGDTYGNCYDGQYFFDVDHLEGDSGTQKNLLAAGDVGALNVATPTAPTTLEAADAVLGVLAHMLTYLDDKGEPMNEQAREFLVMTSPALGPRFSGAVSQRVLGTGTDNPLAMQTDYKVTHVINPRVTWTNQFVLLRTDGATKPLIRQTEVPLNMAVENDSFYNKRQLFGVDLTGNCGYGLWQHAAHATLS